MGLPVIILRGQAGSGKDTVAAFIAKNHNGAVVAMADPMKRFVKWLFGFTDQQLWGASEYRNALVGGFTYRKHMELIDKIHQSWCKSWIKSVLDTDDEETVNEARALLLDWLHNLFADADENGHHGFLSPRKALQTLGTEWGRNLDPDMWVKYALRLAKKLLSGNQSYGPMAGVFACEGANYDYVIISDGRFRNEIINVLAVGGKAFSIESPNIQELANGVPNHASETEQKTIPESWFDAVIHNDKSLGLDTCEYLTNEAMEYTFRSFGRFEAQARTVPTSDGSQ